MSNYLVLTVLADDRAGIVNQIATTIKNHDGNWMESSMSRLAGKFAGILMLEVDPAQQAALEKDLAALASQGIKISIDKSDANSDDETELSCLEIVANDRAGIVGEISALLGKNGVNLVSLETFCESAPMSGEMLFKAQASLTAQPGTDLDDLLAELESIAHDLMVDVSLERPA